ncbi:hypothetical protein KI387_000446, partial [Taxus chinensis]
MAASVSIKLWFFIAAFTVSFTAAQEEAKKTYIVRMDKSAMPTVFPTHEHWYKSFFSSFTQDVEANMIYTYDDAMHGFAARLSKAQVEALAGAPGHLATYEDRRLHLQTTRSYKFLGLSNTRGVWPLSDFGSDVIIGMIDTGIWPESESFNDRGLPDVPTRWKGSCPPAEAFNSSSCNKKLIGARYFFPGNRNPDSLGPPPNGYYKSPRDSDGHGTHTASTAAGRFVQNAEYFGYGKGTAAGVAPGARVAVYKVCFGICFGSSVLAGIDEALKDGVDIMSLSLGSSEPDNFLDDIVGQAVFAAIERGVLPVFAGGNSGGLPGSVVNTAPWVVTVGASTIDRDFQAEVTLANGNVIYGSSYYPIREALFNVPLIHITHNDATKSCSPNSLNSKWVAGKILVCSSDSNQTLYTSFNSLESQMSNQLSEANRTGVTAVIIINDHYPNLYAQLYSMPALVVGPADGKTISTYATTTNASANIVFQITAVGTKPAPVVADFSGRGPAVYSPGIVKPDVVAPGVDILAAYPSNVDAIYVEPNRRLTTEYYLDSGTSMATPHVTGAAALVKAVHPEWSPAAIRSALMTTAHTLDNTKRVISQHNQLKRNPLPGTPLDFGAGHIRPDLAADPGLVYDAGVNDYLDYLCALNFTANQIRIITGKRYSCGPNLSATDINYPSFSAVFDKKHSGQQVVTFHRTVTNVGNPKSVYRADVKAPRSVNVQVKPNVLKFGR